MYVCMYVCMYIGSKERYTEEKKIKIRAHATLAMLQLTLFSGQLSAERNINACVVAPHCKLL